MAQLPQGLLHVLRVVNGQVNTARTVVPVVVFLNRLADRRGVDDGQHLLDVLGDEAEVQHLITVVHVVEVQVLRQVVRLRRVLGVNPLELVGDRHDSRRQQARETKGLALLEGESRASVGQGVRQHLLAASRNLEKFSVTVLCILKRN